MASKRKSPGYWKSLENTIYESKKVMEENNLDKFPIGKKLKELGYGHLGRAISRHHGGFENFKEKHLGEELPTKPRKYWHSLENTIYEINKVMEEQGVDTLPTQNKLKELGHSCIINGIMHHGGMNKFRELLGEELSRKPHGYWSSLENAIYESKKFMEEQGVATLPPGDELAKFGYSSLNAAIHKYHGGFDNFREIMNQELGIKSKEEHLTELVEDYLKD